VWSIIGRLLKTLQPNVVDLPYLITNQPPARKRPVKLSITHNFGSESGSQRDVGQAR
jgi:hypothetical protein